MNKLPLAASDHPVIKPLVLVTPGLVFLFGLSLYGFPAVAWQILALELVAVLIISQRTPLGLAAYFCLALFALPYLISPTGRMGQNSLILFPASTLLYHIYLIKRGGLARVRLTLRDLFITLLMLLWPLLFTQLEPGLATRPVLWLSGYFFLTLLWKVLLIKTGSNPGRLDGKVAAEAVLIVVSLGLGFVPFLSSLGVAFVGDSRWWFASAALLFCLRLTLPKDLK